MTRCNLCNEPVASWWSSTLHPGCRYAGTIEEALDWPESAGVTPAENRFFTNRWEAMFNG